jgi:hypothetical protein
MIKIIVNPEMNTKYEDAIKNHFKSAVLKDTNKLRIERDPEILKI